MIVNILWILIGIGVFILFLITLFSIVYHKLLYNKYIRPKYDESYTPFCSIILPCKGNFDGFYENIEAFAKIDYKNYNVIYVVESEEDAAVEVIKKVTKKYPNTLLAIAGHSVDCGQKNHNMIEAVKKAENAEVLVFADSDIKPSATWLKELILPLSDENITVTTGFRWLYSKNGKLGEIVNVYQNILLMVFFTFVSFFNNIGLWGGSMAIRKKDFDEFGVSEFWSKTVVDDMSLSRIVMKNSLKSVMVANCVTPTNDALQSFSSATKWFERQVMFLKGYQKRQWFLTIPIVTIALLCEIWFFVTLIISLMSSKYGFYDLKGYVAATGFLGIGFSMILYPFLGKFPYYIKSLVLFPVSLMSVNIAVLKTVFTNKIKWSGIEYKINFKGFVTSVKR